MTPPARTALAAVLLLAGGCASSSTQHPTTASQQQPVNDGGTVDARGASTMQVTATNFSFSPSTILANPGQKLTLVFHNTSGTPHNVTASGEGVNQDLAPGATRTVTLTVPASGELVFVCTFHAASGMAGRVGPAGSAGSTPGSSTSPGPKSGGTGGYGSY